MGCELRVVANMNNFGSWAQGFRCYDQHTVLDDMNDSVSHDLKSLDSMNSSRQRIISMIRCYEKLMAMDDVKDSRLWAQGYG